jgi:choline transporter-like protein 2/4/5
VSDLYKSTGVILFIGGIGTMCLSYGYVMMLQTRCAKYLIRFTLLMSILMPLALTLVLFGKAGKLGGAAQTYVNANLMVAAPDSGLGGAAAGLTGVSAAIDAIGQREYETMGIVSAVITCLLFAMVMGLLDKIELAIAILSEASECIGRMPLILVFPIIPIAMLTVLYFFAFMAMGYLLSSPTFAESFHSVYTFNYTTGLVYESSNYTSVAADEGQLDSANIFAFYYFMFGVAWTAEVIQGFAVMTVAGAVTKWYWRAQGKVSLSAFPTR